MIRRIALVALACVAVDVCIAVDARAQDGGPAVEEEETAPTDAPAATDAPPPRPMPLVVDDYTVLSRQGDKRLPDGRATEEACGFEQDVTVEKGGAVRKAILKVPCVSTDAGLGAGAPTLSFPDDKGVDAVKASEWNPIADKELTKRAILKASTVPPYPPEQAAKKVEGVVVLGIDVSESGETRGVEVARPSGTKAFDDAALAAAEKLAWEPAQKAGEPVDSRVRWTVRFEIEGKPTVTTTVAYADGGPTGPPTASGGPAATTEAASTTAGAQVEAACPPLPDGRPDPACAKAEQKKAEHPFLKGELTQMGTVQLVNSRTSFGVGIGATAIDGVFFAVLRPDLNLRFGKFGLGLGAPLRLQIMDTNVLNVADPSTFELAFADLGRFRIEDWDQIEDALRPLKYLTWGRKEDNLFIDLNRVHALTIGHGQLMRRYQPNLDVDEDRLFAEVDGYLDFGGFEVIAGPFPVPRIAGALVFVKPLGLFFDDYVSKSLSIGASYVTDLNAPTTLTTDPNPADARPQLAVDDAGDFLWANRGQVVGDRVQGIGVDSEIKAVKWEFIDLKVYGDYSHLFLPGVVERDIPAFSDGGFALGSLLRMSIGSRPVRPLEDENEDVRLGKAPRELKADHALRFRAEARTFGPQYLPSYFNTLYEVDRLQFGQADRTARAQLPTKIGFLADQAGQPWRAGFFTEASYTWVDYIGFTAAYEDAYPLGEATRPVNGRNLALHAETFGLGWLQLFATYHFRNFENLDGIFSFDSDRELLFFGGRLQLLPILFLNLNFQRAFRVGFAEDDLPGQKRPRIGATAGEPDYRFSSIGLENAWLANFDIELGWQF
jgi:TonB family protein